MSITVPRYVALDRDGTVIRHVHHLTDVNEVALLPGAGGAIRALNEAGLVTLLVTNQSVIGRGLLDWAGLDAIHHRLHELLWAEGAHIDLIAVCPHTPTEGCDCRKPNPTMLHQALREVGYRAEQGYVVGDSLSDIEMGRTAGAQVIHVKTGVQADLPSTMSVSSVAGLTEAVALILGPGGSHGQ